MLHFMLEERNLSARLKLNPNQMWMLQSVRHTINMAKNVEQLG